MKMADKLIIVESPAKSRTIEKYLKGEYHVEATMGHIVDLPKKEFGIDIENGFKPKYVIIDEKKKVVSNLKKKAKNYSEIYLAADPDREGEAICYHLKNLLHSKGKKIFRVFFAQSVTGNLGRFSVGRNRKPQTLYTLPFYI
jgi:DNA topoisomerase-1